MSVMLRTLVTIRSASVHTAVRGFGLATVSSVLALAGCSADITRFDNPSFALGEGASTSIPRRSAGGPPIESPEVLPPPQPYASAPPRAKSGTEVAALPALEPSSAPASTQVSQPAV